MSAAINPSHGAPCPPESGRYKTEHEAAGGSTVGAVPLGHLGFKGQPCPLAGAPVSRNTK